MHFEIRRGIKSVAGPIPTGEPIDRRSVSAVAMMGGDYPNVVFDLRVKEGDIVRTGQTLCVDRQHPDVCFVANASGRVSKIRLGPRRRLEFLEIVITGDDVITFETDDLHRLLLQSGAWTSFRTRPFGVIPEPASFPAAIFVTATEATPQAPNPREVIAADTANFQRCAEALLQLTTGPVFVCQRQGTPLVAQGDRLRVATFSGPYPSGCAGPQIHRLMPVSRQRMVWEIGYQDVIAIGHLLATGRIMTSRVVSVSGPNQAETVTTLLGAKLSDVVGSYMTVPNDQYLGRKTLQVTAQGTQANTARPFWHKILDALPAAPIGAMLPMEALERAFPFDIPPAPLMRALAIGDVETAERLGCLELLEEDLTLLSDLCTSGSDYGQLLRHTLTLLSNERVG